MHREQRSERVAVGVLVRGDEEPLAGAKRVGDRGNVSRRLAHRSSLQDVGDLGAGVQVVDQLRHPDAVLDRLIVFEQQLRRPAQMELAVHARLQDPGGALERGQRSEAPLLAAVDAQPHGRLREIGRRHDAGDGDEADPRILQRRDRLGDDRLDRLVDPAHARRSRRVPSHRATPARARARAARSPGPTSQRSAVSMSRSASPASRATQASVSRERCQTSWWSTSAIEQATRLVSCALTDLRCMRFSFREWLSGKRSSNE